MALPCRGRIVWVELRDPQGQNPKCRPAVILTPTDEIDPAEPVLVAAVSTQVGSFPEAVSVPLPWHREGKARTGLREPCTVVCTWLEKVLLSDVKDYAGVVPGQALREILEKAADLPK